MSTWFLPPAQLLAYSLHHCSVFLFHYPLSGRSSHAPNYNLFSFICTLTHWNWPLTILYSMGSVIRILEAQLKRTWNWSKTLEIRAIFRKWCLKLNCLFFFWKDGVLWVEAVYVSWVIISWEMFRRIYGDENNSLVKSDSGGYQCPCLSLTRDVWGCDTDLAFLKEAATSRKYGRQRRQARLAATCSLGS